MLTLFYTPDTCALASRIVLEEVGEPYSLVRVDFKQQEQRSAEFLAVNPKGRVPALRTDKGVLTETPAILTFIAQTFPQAKLAPLDDAFAFAELQSFNAYLCSTVHVAHAHGRRGSRWADAQSSLDDMKQKVPQTMAACFELIEADLLKGPWVLGDDYSVADAYLFTMSGWLQSDGVDILRFPRVNAHFQRMVARPAVRRAMV